MTTEAGMGLTLGQRILQIARMAAETHAAQLHREARTQRVEAARQQVTGGAESTRSMDGVLHAPNSPDLVGSRSSSTGGSMDWTASIEGGRP